MFDRNDGIFVRIFKVLGVSYFIISWCVAGYLDFKESGIFLERRLTGVPKPPFINQLIKGLMWPYTLYKNIEESQQGTSTAKSNTSCDEYFDDQNLYQMCLLALETNIPLDEIGGMFLTARVDSIIKECHLYPSEGFKKLKEHFSKTSDFNQQKVFVAVEAYFSTLDVSSFCEKSRLEQLAPFLSPLGQYQ